MIAAPLSGRGVTSLAEMAAGTSALIKQEYVGTIIKNWLVWVPPQVRAVAFPRGVAYCEHEPTRFADDQLRPDAAQAARAVRLARRARVERRAVAHRQPAHHHRLMYG